MLPRNVIASLTAVSRLFPDITRETSTGRNLTATGNPKATRMVIYAIHGGSKKVTITVDQYRTPHDASSAYQKAVQKSQSSVPGFKPIRVAIPGQQTFAGAVIIDAETHIGLGVLDDKLIVGATLAGYDATPDNTAKLVALARMQASPQRGPWDASLPGAFEDIAVAAARWGLQPQESRRACPFAADRCACD